MAMMLDEGEASDSELIGLAKDGDRGAFGRLVERHYDFVYRVAYRWCGRKADAEDIAQEVCVRIGRAIRDYRGGGAFTTWLYALTLNAARDHARKSAREGAKVQAYGVHALISGEAPEDADERADGLWAAVRQLPDINLDGGAHGRFSAWLAIRATSVAATSSLVITGQDSILMSTPLASRVSR